MYSFLVLGALMGFVVVASFLLAAFPALIMTLVELALVIAILS